MSGKANISSSRKKEKGPSNTSDQSCVATRGPIAHLKLLPFRKICGRMKGA